MNDVSKVIELISSGRLLSAATFQGIDADSLLDARDRPGFEAEWLRVHDELKTALPGEPAEVARLREATFKVVIGHSGHAELAAYVSDDFGLIGAALACGFEDPWLNALAEAYRVGSVPHEPLIPVAGSLDQRVFLPE